MADSGAQLRGWKRGNLYEEAARAQATQVAVEYDSDEFSIGIVSDQSLRSRGGSKLFVNVRVAHRVVIRSNQNIVCKWNSATNPAFTVEANIPFEEGRLEITDLFITTTAASNGLMIYLT